MEETVVRDKYERITKSLIERGLTVSTMESMTAGLVASLLTDTEGASAVIKGAFVTYSNEAKAAQGVPTEILEMYGVYSKETARAMAYACRQAYAADFGIGITGTTGNPDPNNPDSVPGVVYAAVVGEDVCRDLAFVTERQETRFFYKLCAADKVADCLLEVLAR